MNCERCGGENPENVSFCRRCGHQMGPGGAVEQPPVLPAPVSAERPTLSCPRCGSDNPGHLRYCATCGTTLPKREAPTNPEGARVHTPSRSPAAAPPVPVPQPPLSVPIPAAAAPSTRQFAAPSAAPEPPPASLREGALRSCPRCSAFLVAGAAFCQSCGTDLRRDAAHKAGGAAPPAKLVVIAQDGTPGREYPIVAGRVDVGREQGEVLLNGDPYACPRHARIVWKNGQFWAVDLGSVNGVFARLMAPERLVSGDTVLMGLEVFKFEMVASHESQREPAYERGTRLFGSPALPRYARLVQKTVEGISSNVFYLSKHQSTIGRETGDFVFGDDAFMSRQHATFTRQQDGSFLLTDLGSSNGTFVAIRDERVLPDGGHVRIGQHLFRLKIEG